VEAGSPVILLVEDDLRVCDLVQRLLDRAGYMVRTAVDAPAALALLAEGIDLVLLDVMLPQGDGFELCRLLRTYEGDDYLPVIMLTALTDEAHKHEGFLAGADDYVTKPFTNVELLDRVRVWLRARERMRAHAGRLLHDQEQRLLGERLAQAEVVLAMARTVSQEMAPSLARLQDAARDLAAGMDGLNRMLESEAHVGAE
jgi:DNA-binding response OmpR family regulator